MAYYRRRYPRSYPQWYQIPRLLEGELEGSLHAEYKRCGKPNCRCASGRDKDRHGPYWYRRWRGEDGKQRKAYVPAGDLEEVRAAIGKRRARLARDRAQRNAHMRRGMGHGRPAHEWRRERASRQLLAQLNQLRRLLDRHRY